MMTVIIIFQGATNSKKTAAFLGQIYSQHNFKLAPEIIKTGHNGSSVYNTSREMSQCGWPLTSGKSKTPIDIYVNIHHGELSEFVEL